MKILYGIQGTGNGHVTRSTQIIDTLSKNNADIDVIFSGCTPDKVFDKTVFTPKGFYEGFTFQIKKGRIQFFNTAKNLSFRKFVKDVRSFDASEYDLIITDFEPISAMVAKKNKLPCIGIGHQYAFAHKIPMDRSNLFARLILGHFAAADHAIGMHWHHFDQPIIPPVIPDTIKPVKKIDPNLILVYLPFESADHIRSFLYPFKSLNFAVYAGHKNIKKTQDKNISWNPFSKTTFYTDLAQCSGVICNAGFELPSEALSLGKKLLVKPLKGQFEQISNAKALTHLGLGAATKKLNKKSIKKWLDTPGAVKKDYSDVARQISDWVIKGNWSDTSQLVENCWN